MAEIKAIPTRYAGCHFRSRLEARWAVFFDTMGVQWEYEAQGYETDGGRYLPDFWLPEPGIWAEVKGVVSHPEFVKILRAIHGLRAPEDDQIQPQLLILGPIPRPGVTWLHVRADIQRSNLMWSQVYFEAAHYVTYPIGQPVIVPPRFMEEPGTEEITAGVRRYLVQTFPEARLAVDPIVDEAYRAARSARFEFGQSG